MNAKGSANRHWKASPCGKIRGSVTHESPDPDGLCSQPKRAQTM
jgi:hypothetical protein